MLVSHLEILWLASTVSSTTVHELNAGAVDSLTYFGYNFSSGNAVVGERSELDHLHELIVGAVHRSA